MRETDIESETERQTDTDRQIGRQTEIDEGHSG